MTKDDQREVKRKLRVLQHAERTAHVAKTCRYFGVDQAIFTVATIGQQRSRGVWYMSKRGGELPITHKSSLV